LRVFAFLFNSRFNLNGKIFTITSLHRFDESHHEILPLGDRGHILKQQYQGRNFDERRKGDSRAKEAAGAMASQAAKMTGPQGRNVSAVILAGGKSRRMGVDKARLPWRDGKTLLERVAGCLWHLDEVLLSVGAEEQVPEGLSLPRPLSLVLDRCPNRGPMGGIYSALLACRWDWLLVVSCDLPLFEKELADYLISHLIPKVSDEYNLVLTVTRDGRVHPLCGLYSKGAAETLRRLMASGSYRMMDAVREAGFLPVNLAGTPFPDEALTNVNTFREYALLFAGHVRRPPVVAVSGLKKSGKTALLEKLVPVLVRRGLRVAVIKHDGHDFTPDVPGTDSFRLRAAGAWGTAVYSANRWMVVKDARGATPEQMAEHFPEADLILLEGEKSSSYPKIEVVGNGASPVCDPSALLALCTNEDCHVEGVPSFSPDDCEGLATLLMESMK
jgi:molybdopterin-guanine dinucleotide biosynthesis protein MobB